MARVRAEVTGLFLSLCHCLSVCLFLCVYVCLRVYRTLWGGGARTRMRVQGFGFKSHIDEKMLEGFESMFFTQPSVRLRGTHRAMPQVLGQAIREQAH